MELVRGGMGGGGGGHSKKIDRGACVILLGLKLLFWAAQMRVILGGLKK